MTAREVLDGIRGRLAAANDYPGPATLELSQADVARLVAAVEGVLGLTETTQHTHRLGGLPIVFVEDVRAAVEAALNPTSSKSSPSSRLDLEKAEDPQ